MFALVVSVGVASAAPVVGLTIVGGDVSLGVYDHLGNGLIDRHEVGLWNAGGTLLASTTVKAGVASVLDGGFRYEDIAPVALASGQTYYVAALFTRSFGNDGWIQDPASIVVNPLITYESRRFTGGAGGLACRRHRCVRMAPPKEDDR